MLYSMTMVLVSHGLSHCVRRMIARFSQDSVFSNLGHCFIALGNLDLTSATVVGNCFLDNGFILTAFRLHVRALQFVVIKFWSWHCVRIVQGVSDVRHFYDVIIKSYCGSFIFLVLL